MIVWEEFTSTFINFGSLKGMIVLPLLQGTSVVYCVFSACIVGLGAVRGIMESDLDLTGRPHEHTHMFMATLLILQVWTQ